MEQQESYNPLIKRKDFIKAHIISSPTLDWGKETVSHFVYVCTIYAKVCRHTLLQFRILAILLKTNIYTTSCNDIVTAWLC